MGTAQTNLGIEFGFLQMYNLTRLIESILEKLSTIILFFSIVQYFQNIISEQVFLPRKTKGWLLMQKKHIAEITRILNNLDENQLLYILTFIRKIFGMN